jgi:hypothetical protein
MGKNFCERTGLTYGSGCRTLGFTCGRKPERGTSEGWRQSGASPGWALALARARALVTPPAVFPLRPPSDDGSPPPGRTRPLRVGAGWGGTPPRSPRSPATRLVPPGATHEGHPLLRPARTATPKSRVEVRHEARREGGAAHAYDPDTPHGPRRSAALRHRRARAWGGPAALAQGARRPDHVARPALLLPLSWRHARRATERLHTLAEHRPTPDGAPGLGATPSQVGQSFLTLAVSSAVFLPAPQAPNAGAHLLPEAVARNERRL